VQSLGPTLILPVALSKFVIVIVILCKKSFMSYNLIGLELHVNFQKLSAILV